MAISVNGGGSGGKKASDRVNLQGFGDHLRRVVLLRALGGPALIVSVHSLMFALWI